MRHADIAMQYHNVISHCTLRYRFVIVPSIFRYHNVISHCTLRYRFVIVPSIFRYRKVLCDIAKSPVFDRVKHSGSERDVSSHGRGGGARGRCSARVARRALRPLCARRPNPRARSRCHLPAASVAQATHATLRASATAVNPRALDRSNHARPHAPQIVRQHG